jgi:hypothetical protein
VRIGVRLGRGQLLKVGQARLLTGLLAGLEYDIELFRVAIDWSQVFHTELTTASIAEQTKKKDYFR